MSAKTKGKTSGRGGAGAVLAGVLASAVLVLSLLGILAFLVQKGKVSEGIIPLWLVFSLLMASAAGSWTAAAGINKGSRRLRAAIPSALLALLIVLGRWFGPAGEGSRALTIPALLAALLPGVLATLKNKGKRRT